MLKRVGVLLIIIGIVGVSFSTVFYLVPRYRLSAQSLLSGQERTINSEVTDSTEGRVPIILDLDVQPMTIDRPSSMTISSQHTRVMSLVQPLTVNYDFQTYSTQEMSIFGFAAGTVPLNNVGDLVQHPNVVRAAKDRLIRIPQPALSLQEDTGEIEYLDEPRLKDKLRLENLWEVGMGENINVAIIDSGIQEQYVDVSGSFGVGQFPPFDDYGHGTVVASLVRLAAPKADIYPIRCMDKYGQGRSSDIISALGTAVQEVPSPTVVNMSLGTTPSRFSPLKSACLIGSKYHKLHIFTSAGNSGDNYVLSPATAKTTVSVGALEPDNDLTFYSNYGYDQTVSMYGDLYVNWLGRRQQSSGTSWASPLVTGMVACKLSSVDNPEKVDVKGLLRNSSKDLGTEGYDPVYGHGLPVGDKMADAEVPYGRDYEDNYPFILAGSLAITLLGALLFIKGYKG